MKLCWKVLVIVPETALRATLPKKIFGLQLKVIKCMLFPSENALVVHMADVVSNSNGYALEITLFDNVMLDEKRVGA